MHLEECRQPDRQFEPGEGCANAEVDPSTERCVSCDRPSGYEVVRRSKDIRIPVRRGQQNGNRVAPGESLTEQGLVAFGVALEDVQRRVEPEYFLNRGIATGRRQQFGRVLP